MQTIHFKAASSLAVVFMILFVFSSCKKDPVIPPVAQPVNQELIIQFSTSGIGMGTIDSVVAIVRDQNNMIKLWKTLDKAATSFKLNLQQLASGNYKTEVMAYSKIKTDLTARQYALVKEVQLPMTQPVIINAPTGTFTDAWYQRAIFFGPVGTATIIVAMDPRDSYYEVRFNRPNYRRIYLERSSLDGNVLVAAKSKIRNIEGLVGLSEYGDFTPYVQLMQQKNWTKGTIGVYIDPAVGGEIDVYYEYPNN
ncbi:MAG: hypothetical protein Q7T76_08155 [Ferruginibacter sp.]|nr:hypothetical protein [Ferruginibacter sp.]